MASASVRAWSLALTNSQPLHDTDFLAWTREQAKALRGAATATPAGGFDRALDWQNLAEEIEDLGTSRRSALSSQVTRILHHLLKLEFSPAQAPRNGWRRSVREARVAVDRILEDNPSLRQDIAQIAQRSHRPAVALASGDLEDEGEGDLRATMDARRYDADAEVLADWWPPLPPPA